MRQDKGQAGDLMEQLVRAQTLLRQRDAALAQLTAQLDAATARRTSASGGAAPPPPRPLSRHNSGAGDAALLAELADKASRIKALEEELAEARSRIQVLSPRPLSRRESVEESGLAVVGGGGLSAHDANRLRALRAEGESWRDRAEGLMGQVRELQRERQVSGRGVGRAAGRTVRGGAAWGAASISFARCMLLLLSLSHKRLLPRRATPLLRRPPTSKRRSWPTRRRRCRRSAGGWRSSCGRRATSSTRSRPWRTRWGQAQGGASAARVALAGVLGGPALVGVPLMVVPPPARLGGV